MSAAASTALATTRRAIAIRSSRPLLETASGACSYLTGHCPTQRNSRVSQTLGERRKSNYDSNAGSDDNVGSADVPYQCEDLRHSTLEGMVERLIDMRRLYEDSSSFESVIRSTLGGWSGEVAAVAPAVCGICGGTKNSCDLCSNGEQVVAFIQGVDRVPPSSLRVCYQS